MPYIEQQGVQAPTDQVQEMQNKEAAFNYQREQEKIKQQQLLAAALYQTKMPNGQMIGNRFVAPSGAEYMAAGLQKMLGAYQLGDSQKQADEVETKKQKAMADALSRFTNDNGATSPQDKIAAASQMINSGDPTGVAVGQHILNSTLAPKEKKTTQVIGNSLIEQQTDGTWKEVAQGTAKPMSDEDLEIKRGRNELYKMQVENQKSQQDAILEQRKTEQDKKVEIANSKFETAKKEKLASFEKSDATLLEAEALLKQNPTHSGFGAQIDEAYNMVGGSTRGADLSAKLEVLGGNMLLSVPRFEGPQSDKDVAVYKEMAGKIGDKTIPITQRLAALETIRTINTKHKEIVTSTTPPVSNGSTPTQTAQPTQAPSGQSVPMAVVQAEAAKRGISVDEVIKRFTGGGYTIGK